MIKIPKANGLILCDRFLCDPAAGQVSLRGLYVELEVFDFAQPFDFTLYALLEGGQGQGRMTITLYQIEHGEAVLIHRFTRWYGIPPEPRAKHFEQRLHVRFGRSGTHLIRLRFEGILIAERRFELRGRGNQ